MKNLFGQITGKRENRMFDGTLFLKEELPDRITEEIDEAQKAAEAECKRTEMPVWLCRISKILFCISLFLLLGLLRAVLDVLEERTLSEVLCAIPWTFYVALLATLLGAVLFFLSGVLISKKRTREYDEKGAETKAAKYGAMIERSFTALHVPVDALDLNVLIFPYKKRKDGKPSQSSVGFYLDSLVKAYVQKNELCIAGIGFVWGIPLCALNGMEKRKKRIRIMAEPLPELSKEERKSFGITIESDSIIRCKWFGVLKLVHNGELFELFVPPYETEKLRGLLMANGAVV